MTLLKKLFIMTLVVIIWGTSSSYAIAFLPWNMAKKNEYINNLYNIYTKEIYESSEFFKADIEFPYLQIKDLNDRDNEDSINTIKNIDNEIYDYIYSFYKELEKQSQQYKKEYEKEFEKNGYNKYQYEASTDYFVAYNKKNLLSIPITTYEFTGGAHGLTSLKSFNYDLKKGIEVELKDIFKENVEYKKIINSYIEEEIKKNEDLYFKGKDGFNGISDNQSFYLNKNGLVIYFSLYEIAPYYIGIPKFTISYKDLEPYLNIEI